MVGCWVAVWHQALLTLWSPTVAASLSTLVGVWLTGEGRVAHLVNPPPSSAARAWVMASRGDDLTGMPGCFHEDGLSDCFDGFGGGWGRTQILRIMKDSRVGTYALVGVLLCTVAKLALLSEMEAAVAPRALVAAHTVGRWTSLPMLHWCHYIQDDEDAKRGMYNWFAQSQRLFSKPRLLFGTALTVAICAWAVGAAWCAALMLMASAVAALAAAYGHCVIRGVVGDFLGATIMVCELAVYMAMSARWEALTTGGMQAWRPLLQCALVSLGPLLYARRIVDFNSSC